MFPRTYRIAGTPASAEQRAVAATLWAGPGAVVSHDTAAHLWGLIAAAGKVHVTAARQLTRPPSGIIVHTSRLDRRDKGPLRGIPVTSPARTVLDLAATRTEEELFPLVERAVLDGLVTDEHLRDSVVRNRGRRGAGVLGRVLDLGSASTSALERRIAAILARSGLPPHRREYPVGHYRLDFAWPEQRLAVEADGRRWHSSRDDFTRDRAKHNALLADGWRVLRVTWDDEPGPLVASLSGLLAAPAAYPGSPGATDLDSDLEVGQWQRATT